VKKKHFIFGEWVEKEGPLTSSEAQCILEKAQSRRAAIQNFPQDKTLRVLQSLGQVWADPKNRFRQKCLKELPVETGFSKEMIEVSLQSLSDTLSADKLERKLKTELRGIVRGEWKWDRETNTRHSFEPLGIILHILSGNVYLVGLGSLVEGLLTGNVTLLKQSSEETVFLPYLMESLQEIDKEGVLAKSVAVFDYPSTDQEVIRIFKRAVDGIVIWGGEEAVKAYRNELPARTRVIVYGPKLSFAVVTEKGIHESSTERVADQIAKELMVWDQNACTAPQMVFVEKEDSAQKLASHIADSLGKVNQVIPPGSADLNTAVEIQKIRGVREIAQARGEGRLWSSTGNVDWTVFTSTVQSIEPSPLHRTIKIVGFEKWEEIEREMELLRGYIQTVGLCVGHEEVTSLSEKLFKAGALRVLEVGQMGSGEIDDPHDGSFDLSQFGNFVFQRGDSQGRAPEDEMPIEKYQSLIDSRLRILIDHAKRSPFYSQKLLGVEVEGIRDLPRIPILSRKNMEEQGDPQTQGLKTRDWWGGYVTRSGGSTGKPKFSIYDGPDWEALVNSAMRVLEGAGLRKGDRVANCMLAGDLYGSFVSFDHINSRVGATSFAFAGELKVDVFLQTWLDFKINVIEAIPTVLMPLLRKCKEKERDFAIEKVIFGGQPLSPADREWIVEHCGAKRISSIIGANDGGHLGYQCAFSNGNIHHLVDDYNFIEIVNRKGETVAEGESGKVLITTLQKLGFPLIRYEIGDSARFVSGQCECGRKGRRIEYLGRTDDMVSVGLMNFNYSDVLGAIGNEKVSLVQVVAKSSEKGESIQINIETEQNTQDFAQKIRDKLLGGIPRLAEALSKGSLFSLDISLKKPGELIRDPRTGKVRLVIDERL